MSAVPAPTEAPTPKTLMPRALLTPSSGPELAQPVIASSELAVGQERFVFGLVSTRTGLPIKDVPVVGLQLFKGLRFDVRQHAER